MAGRYPDILVHCVFRRRNGGISCLKALLPKLWKYGAGIGRNHGIFVLAAGYFEPCSFTNCAPDLPPQRVRVGGRVFRTMLIYELRSRPTCRCQGGSSVESQLLAVAGGA